MDDVPRRAAAAVIREHDAGRVVAEGGAQFAAGGVEPLVDGRHRAASRRPRRWIVAG
jgi:hypothetical protein